VISGASHALTIGYLAYVVLTTTDRLWPAIWLFAGVLDFPISLLYWLGLDLVIPPAITIALVSNPTSRLNSLSNFWIPFLFFLTVGTWWAFMLPRMIIGRPAKDVKEQSSSAYDVP
jgi:hypothetical protein